MMKTTFVTMLALGTWPLISTAMPTKAELDKVSPVVADLMRPEQEALKAGKKSKSEVAAAALELVAKADGEAAKLLLTKGAYNLYVRDGDFDKAIATLKSFREIVPDMEPQYLANIIESSLRTISRKNGGQLYRLLDETRTIARYRGEVKKLETKAKETPTDKSLQLKLAEDYAVLNDWTNALDAFELSSDRKASDVAKMEKANAKTLKVAADFWWNYPVRKVPEFEKPFRQHAAQLYEQAIASGELVGLNKVQADRRIEEAKEYGDFLTRGRDSFDSRVVMLRLAAGVDLELIKCPAGEFTMGYENWDSFGSSINREARKLHKVKLTKDFMLGRFPITQAQWAAIMSPESKGLNDMAGIPVANITVAQMEEYCERMTKKFKDQLGGKVFRLPTEAEWEYASKGGRNLDGLLGKDRRLREHNGKLEDILHKLGYMVEDHAVQSNESKNFVEWGLLPVGKFMPNEWGFQDMTGNAWEVMADKVRGGLENAQGRFKVWNGAEKYQALEVDPCRDETYHLIRGGFWEKGNCGPSEKRTITHQCRLPSVGFRICLGEKIGGRDNASSLKVNGLKEPRRMAKAVSEENSVSPQELAQKRMAKDKEIYGESLREVELLYATFSKTGDKATLQTLIDKYPKANRTGCAALYFAQKEAGARRMKLLNQVIQNFSDCYYGDGCSVGGRARLLLVEHLLAAGESVRARAVAEEIRRDYAQAVNHDGVSLVSQLEALEHDGVGR